MLVVKKVKISEVKALLERGKKVSVKTRNNEFVPVINYVEKGVLPTFSVVLKNGLSIKVTATHRFFGDIGWIKTKDLLPDKTKLFCDDGTYSTVKEVKNIGKYPIVDITVDHSEHCYFGNGILNHNTGKSYMAALIAANAQKMGFNVAYFDSESSLDPTFLEMAGCNLEDLVYTQATDVEFVLESIETILNARDRNLFIWDSLALTPSRSDIESDFDPQSSMAVKPRILSKGLAKLLQPIANKNSIFLVLNQLKTNITRMPAEAMVTPFFTPGGKALNYAYSLRIWLTGRKSKASFVLDENGYRIGSEVKAKLEKSKFGTMGRECSFKILWGGESIHVMDEESWLESLRNSSYLTKEGHSLLLHWPEGSSKEPVKFRESQWLEILENEEVRARVLQLLDEELVDKFAHRKGNASAFYHIDPEEAGDEPAIREEASDE